MKQEAKGVIEKTDARELPATETRRQPDVLPKSGPGSSSKSATSKTTDRKRPKQDTDLVYSFHSTSQSSSETYSSPSSESSPKRPREPSKCPYCPVLMTRTNDLRKHVEKIHQGPQEMLCHVCDFRCNDIVTYLAHENDHLVKCPYCGYMAKNYRGLPRHKAFCRMNPNYEESTLGSTRREVKETEKKE